ncbi:MAG TPA: hypothetical protein VJ783_12695 [Pirellulales bacterium]|nr:hypothetical protein [Pirellulales bacterium]
MIAPRLPIAALAFAAVAFWLPAGSAAGQARVEIELATERTFIATSQQQWYRLFTELGIDNLRIRKAFDGEKAETKTAGTKASPVYRVTGLLQAGDVLVLPGGKFGLRDRARLADWLANLRDQGPNQADAPQGPFHLDAGQLAAVNSDLSRRVGIGTTELTPADLLSKLSARLKHPVVVDRLAKTPLADAEPIRTELKSLAAGTALAYALRGAGLGLAPRRNARKQVEYAIIKPAAKQITWPPGWPLEPKKPRDVLPALFETLNVDIDDYPLDEALTAISEKLGAPILYDRYALARQDIDVTKARVTFPPGKSWYYRIIDKLLFQSSLKGEWRLDDAGKPLLWVTTLKPVRD